jgi:hypothetical protein
MPDLDINQLVQMQMMMRGLTPQNSFGPNWAPMPEMYGMNWQGGPAPTHIPLLDPLLQTFAPMVAGGLGWQFRPYTPPEITPWMANYLARSQGQYFQGAQQQMLGQMGGAFASDLTNMMVNMRIPQAFNLDVNTFRQNMADLGQGPGGQFAMMGLMQIPQVQALMAGNPAQMQQNIFAARSALYGGMVNPLDPTQQGIISANAVEFSRAMFRAAHGTPEGGMSILPNFQFTRGFLDQDIGAVAGQMAMQGFRGFVGPGVSADTQTRIMGQMNRIAEVLGGLTGETALPKLFQHLSALTNGQLPQINLDNLERTFQNISAVAKVMGVHGSEMIRTMATVQGALGGALGIGPAQQAMGFTGGEMQGVEATAYITRGVMGAAAALGTRSPQQIAQITAQHMALRAAGLQSQGGQDIMNIAWLEQSGRITAGTAESYRQAIMSGNPAAIQGAADVALTAGYGTAGAGRAFFADPNVRLQLYNQIQRPAETVYPYIERAQEREFAAAVGRVMLQGQQAGARNAMRDAGRPIGLDTRTMAEAQLGAAEAYLRDLGPAGTGLAAVLRREYDAGIAGGVSPAQAMANVQFLINTTPQFQDYRQGIAQAQEAAVMRGEAQRFVTDPTVRQDRIRQAEMQAARRMSMSLGQDVMNQIDAVQNKENKDRKSVV